MYKTPANNGINYQPQLVSLPDSFPKHFLSHDDWADWKIIPSQKETPMANSLGRTKFD